MSYLGVAYQVLALLYFILFFFYPFTSVAGGASDKPVAVAASEPFFLTKIIAKVRQRGWKGTWSQNLLAL